MKRILDIAVAAIALLLLAPAMAIVALIIRFDSPGPAIFRQERVGRNFRRFYIYKFRTMVVDAWAKGPAITGAADPRVTRVGQWLRRAKLDELPQLWNVLRGDMSLVGPRPVVAQELDEYYGPAAQLYVRTRPGLTGLWQVSGRSDTSYERRIFLDEWYILNWSFWYDIVILIQTAWIVATGKGAF
jgi:undecaprenyl-phosphate galactose phosphotransferase